MILNLLRLDFDFEIFILKMPLKVWLADLIASLDLEYKKVLIIANTLSGFLKLFDISRMVSIIISIPKRTNLFERIRH